tara:strand:- start:531 stop:1475 length:945 start_codon:yes stop_codon:yes gene_type:complete
MKSPSESGYALALLLWMITGMSLMVTAVIHFARDDIGLSELRINEAKSRALSRGLGFLVSRDIALRQFEELRAGIENTEEGSRRASAAEDVEDGATQALGPFEYRFDRVVGSVTVRPASGLVSLNNASEEELFRTIVALGLAESGEAIGMMQGIIDYRNQVSPVSRDMTDFRGFRFREELLAVEGLPRAVYDRVKDFVHVHKTMGLDPANAPPGLASLFAGEQMPADTSGAASGGGKSNLNSRASLPLAAGPVTFDAIYARRRLEQSGETNAKAVIVNLSFDNGFQARYRVWMSGSGSALIRSESLSSVSRGGV